MTHGNVQEASTATSMGVPGEVPRSAEHAPEHLPRRRDWLWKDHPDPTVVCRLLKKSGQEEGCLHPAEKSGGDVSFPACRRGVGCQPGSGGGLQHQVRGLLRAKDPSEIHDRWYVAEGGDVRPHAGQLPGDPARRGARKDAGHRYLDGCPQNCCHTQTGPQAGDHVRHPGRWKIPGIL